MKINLFLNVCLLCSIIGMNTSCKEAPLFDDDQTFSDLNYNDQTEINENLILADTTSLASVTLDELQSFSIQPDNTPLTEDETLPDNPDDAHYEDYVEHTTITNTLYIHWNEAEVEITGDKDAVSIHQNAGDITITSSTQGMRYILSGTCSDGQMKIYSDYKFALQLNGVNLHNSDGAAINIQSKKRAYVIVADNTTNSLEDGNSYANTNSSEDEKGTFFSEGQLCFSGIGTLHVIGHYKNGIASDDYIYIRPGIVLNVTSSGTNGIKANEYIHIEGGVLNINVTSAAGKGLNSDGYVKINGGRSTIITSGGIDETDYSSAACVKTDSIFVINNGSLCCKSTGQGGKGIKVGMNSYFNGGKTRIICSGSNYGTSQSWGGPWQDNSSSTSSSAKGIRVEGKLFINGGNLMVRCSSHEAMESKSYIEFNGGSTLLYSYDDAINSVGNLVFNHGYVYAQSTANDGIDSNGDMLFNGGVIMGVGPSNGAEGGIDVNEEGGASIRLNGGIVIALGSRNSSPEEGSQYALTLGSSGMGRGRPGNNPGGHTSQTTLTANTLYAICNANQESLLVFTPPSSTSNCFLSCPELQKGNTYTLYKDIDINGGIDFCGLKLNANISGGTSIGSATITSQITQLQ